MYIAPLPLVNAMCCKSEEVLPDVDVHIVASASVYVKQFCREIVISKTGSFTFLPCQFSQGIAPRKNLIFHLFLSLVKSRRHFKMIIFSFSKI